MWFSSNLLKFTIPIARSGSQLSWVLTSDPSLIWNTEVDLLLPVIHSELWKHLIIIVSTCFLNYRNIQPREAMDG